MSRVGQKPIPVPKGVSVRADDGLVTVKGPKGELSVRVPDGLSVAIEGETIRISASNQTRKVRALWGLGRSLVRNAVEGVVNGFERRLVVVGIGYRAERDGRNLRFSLGYSHPINFPAPEGIEFGTEPPVPGVEDAQAVVVVRGVDKQLVGHTAAEIRMLRRPEPYKGKGIRRLGEQIRRKDGKAGA